MRVNRAGTHTHLQANKFKTWLREATAPHKPAKWTKLVELVHLIWERRTIPAELGWTILIIIPKGKNYTWGIGIL